MLDPMIIPHSDSGQLEVRLKQLLKDQFRLSASQAGNLTADEPLIGGRLGLDSLDALALSLNMEEEFGFTIGSAAESRAVYASLASLAGFIREHRAKNSAPGLARLPRPLAALS